MSLLADKDYLLQSLQLSYIRHVLPNHSTQSSLQGVGPHNLISFDTYSPIFQSPYVVLGGLTDEERWPELKSGRNSPPLGLGRGRDPSGDGTGGRRRLNYSQTIVGKGSGKGGAGMRTEGRERTWKGRASETTSLAAVEDPPGAVLNRKDSMEKSLHIRRFSLDGALPPPVIIHSPARTPHDFVTDLVDPHSQRAPSTPPSPLSLSNTRHAPLHSPTSYSGDEFSHSDMDAEPQGEGRYERSPRTSASFDDDSINEGSLNEELLSPQPLSDISEQQALSSISRSAPLEIQSSQVGPLSLEQGSSFASSGNSLFGVSRVTGSGGDSIQMRNRRDSESSLINDSEQRITVIEEEEESSPIALPQPIVNPPLGRIRERRRVNFSNGMFVPAVLPVEATEAQKRDTVVPPTSPIPNVTPATTLEDARSVLREGTAGIAEQISTLYVPNPVSQPRTTVPTLPKLNTSSLPKGDNLSLPLTPSRQPNFLTFPRSQTSTTSNRALPVRSALTELLSAKSSSPGSSNPFSSLYASSISKASDALSLSIYFPHSKTPSKKIKIQVKKDLTVEEVIGAGLWAYWEEEKEPALTIGEDSKGEIEDETTRWNLRIVEDDGEVDDDFPALDRNRAVSAFSFGEFAVVKATRQQITDNIAKQALNPRRPSRALPPPVPQPLRINTALAPPLPTAIDDNGGTMLGPVAATGSSRSPAPSVLLRVRVPPLPGVEAIETTVSLPSNMYIQDVIYHICHKRELGNPKEWVLLLQDVASHPVVPLDHTVDTLGDRPSVILVRRNQLAGIRSPTIPSNSDAGAALFRQTTAILRSSDRETSALLNSTYQRYTVNRKSALSLGRTPYTLTIDGNYIHLMPSDNKGNAEEGRTVSFYILNVTDCKVSKRAPGTFRLVVKKDRGVEKRYDFEAADAGLAKEIVAGVSRVRARRRG